MGEEASERKTSGLRNLIQLCCSCELQHSALVTCHSNPPHSRTRREQCMCTTGNITVPSAAADGLRVQWIREVTQVATSSGHSGELSLATDVN